jgi:hypothetical protein
VLLRRRDLDSDERHVFTKVHDLYRLKGRSVPHVEEEHISRGVGGAELNSKVRRPEMHPYATARCKHCGRERWKDFLKDCAQCQRSVCTACGTDACRHCDLYFTCFSCLAKCSPDERKSRVGFRDCSKCRAGPRCNYCNSTPEGDVYIRECDTCSHTLCKTCINRVEATNNTLLRCMSCNEQRCGRCNAKSRGRAFVTLSSASCAQIACAQLARRLVWRLAFRRRSLAR